MIRLCLEGQPLTVRHPDDRRDLLHIDDAVDGLMQLSAAKLMGHTVVSLATGEAPSMREAAKLVLAAPGADPSPVTLSDTQPSRTPSEQVGKASCRERVCKYVKTAVVAVSLQKKLKDQPGTKVLQRAQ